MQEITLRTAGVFGTTVLGLHDGQTSQFRFFASIAHRRDAQGKFIMPDNPEDHLYANDGKPLADSMKRWVAGTLIDASNRRADDHAFFLVKEKTYAAIKNWVEEKALNPGKYHTLHNNCVKFVLNALTVGDLKLPTQGLSSSVARLRRPEDVSSALATIAPDGHVRAAQRPLLLNQETLTCFM